jgi:DNA gyrase subunit A
MGRTSRGVTGIKLAQNDELAGVVVVTESEEMFTVTEYGYGKRTRYEEFSPHGRGTGGQIAYGVNERTGEVVDVLSVSDDAEVMIITSQGQTIKLAAATITTQGRSASGVRVVDIKKPDFVVGIDRTANEDPDDEAQMETPKGAPSAEEPSDTAETDSAEETDQSDGERGDEAEETDE